MNPARMLGRYSLIFATALSATAVLSACSDDDAQATQNEKRADAEQKDKRAESDAGHATESDAAATQKPSHADKDGAKPDESAKGEEKPKADMATAAEGEKKDESAGFCGAMNVVQSECQVCHGTTLAAGAPMPLVNYADFMAPAVSDPSRKVYELVKERTHDQKKPMPPRGLLRTERLAPLEGWLNAGAPKNNEAACKPVDFMRAKPDESWPKDCEDIYTITAHDPDDPSKPYTIPANSEIHPFITVDAPWGDDEVQLLATRPITDNAQVVHHWILWEAQQRINLTFWAPGASGDSFPDDVGLYMPKGKASMGLDMHYFNKNNDKPAYDRSGLQVCTTRKHRREKTATLYGLFGNATVPAMQRVVNATSCTVKGELHLLGVNPHMHHLGVHAHLDLRRGGQEPTQLLYDGPFSFEEQTMKPLEDTLIKEGDVFTTICTFENTTSRDITFGESTEDEMCINWIRYYPKGGFSCSRTPTDDGSKTVDDPNSNGNGEFPTGDDAGVAP